MAKIKNKKYAQNSPAVASREGGAAMMISLIFFIVVSVIVVLGLTGPAAREFKTANDALASKQSYFLAESGTEDAYYRLENNKQLGSTETLVLGSTTATTAITTLGSGQKEIKALGNDASKERAVDIKVLAGTGVSFNYGVEVGEGGISMSGSGSVIGNVYANGPITGDSSSSITGTAVSADSPALTADQSNGSGTPATNVSFANATATQDIAQSFKVATANSPLNKIQLYLKKSGSPSNATVDIVNDASGTPGSTILATGTLSASLVTTSYGWIDVSFATNPVLDTSLTYWLVVNASPSSSNYYVIGANSAGYANGAGKIGTFGGTWNNTTPSGLDYFFKVYLGGLTGLIQGNSLSQYNQLHVGTTGIGTAQAHTVNYTNATGTIYCTSGTGNNQACTPATDPTFQSYPISDADIASWESDATAGGTYSGTYTVGYAGATIGPEKINGDLDIAGGGTLTVTGTLYVTGSINLSGGGHIVLDPSYGANDGVIICDGTITVTGGTGATGSGQTGSYLLMLSTSSSTSAGNLSGGSGAVILYIPNGTLNISGGASLKEATAYSLSISGGSSVSYQSGLANMNFTSGPSGSYNISSWKETQ